MAKVFHFEDLDWQAASLDDAPDSERSAWRTHGPPARSRVLEGEGGYWANMTRFPPGFRIWPHSHDKDELMVVVHGSCDLDGVEVRAGDTVLIPANERYSFMAGPDGLRFLVVRPGNAAYSDRR